MNETQKLVYVTLGEEICSRIYNELFVDIDSLELLIALVEESGKSVPELAKANLSADEIISIYRKSKAYAILPKIDKKIELEISIIPPDTEVSILEKQVKHKGEVWVVHKNDQDPFPSAPHAHNYEMNLKLHLGNGDLYHQKKLVNRIKYKDLIMIRDKLGPITLPELECRA